MKTGKFSVVDGDVFKFDEGIDAIYYERRYLTNSTEKNIKENTEFKKLRKLCLVTGNTAKEIEIDNSNNF